jgi:hypothetical protein
VAVFWNVIRSGMRVLVAVLLIGGAGLAGLTVALRQPTVTALPFRASIRADERALSQHVHFLTNDLRPRSSSHTENLDRAAAYIGERFRSAGARVTFEHFVARKRRYTNVVARFGPESSMDPVVVVGAHYDSFGETGALPGADDNASGTAGLLALARLLGAHPPEGPAVLAAYANEEPPFFGSDEMGSAVHANALAAAGTRVRAMICLEMIGYFSADQSWPNALFHLLYPSRGDFIGVVGGWSDRALARRVKRAMTGAGGIPVVSFNGPREASDASDQRNYWRHGWSAVMVTDTAFLRNPNYHTAHDRAETLNYRRMASVVDGVFNAVLHLTSG